MAVEHGPDEWAKALRPILHGEVVYRSPHNPPGQCEGLSWDDPRLDIHWHAMAMWDHFVLSGVEMGDMTTVVARGRADTIAGLVPEYRRARSEVRSRG